MYIILSFIFEPLLIFVGSYIHQLNYY